MTADSTALPVAYRERAESIEGMVSSISIASEDDLKALSDRIAEVKDFRLAAEKERDASIEPAKAIIAQAKKTWDPVIDRSKELEAGLKQKGIDFTVAARAADVKQVDAIIGRIGEGRGYLKEETAVRQLGEIKRIPSTVKTGGSTFQVKEVRDYEVTDESLIPEEYFDRTLNRARLRAAVVTAKLDVPGTKVVIKNQAASGR